MPRESERRIPRPEKVSRLIGILKGEVESPVDSFTLISPMMCRLHDECASQVLDMPDIFDISEAVYNLYSQLYTAEIRTNQTSLICKTPPDSIATPSAPEDEIIMSGFSSFSDTYTAQTGSNENDDNTAHHDTGMSAPAETPKQVTPVPAVGTDNKLFFDELLSEN